MHHPNEPEITMKLLFRITALTFCLCSLVCNGQDTINDPILPGSGGDPLLSRYSSPLTPTLSVAPVGGDAYAYTITFQNTDASPIWNFAVFSRVAATSYSRSFPYYIWQHSLSSVIAAYDARNLDPGLADMINMSYAPPWGTGGLAVGGSGQISFTLPGYYTSFIYAYETDASGWAANNGGYQAAIGVVGVPEASSLALVSLGAAVLIGVRRLGYP